MKRPAFQFYPADWRKDLELQSCSIAARGLWHEMMCVMHEAEPYGHLVLNGRAMTDIQAATACRVTPQQYRTLFAELKAAGVPGLTDEGISYSRRMVRDEETRNARAEGGKSGAEHGVKGKEHGNKGGRPRKETGDKKPPLNPPPSSSTSSSSSNLNLSEANASEAPGTAGSLPCPHSEIVGLYHQILPSCPRVIEWNEARQGYLRSRWREKAKANGTAGYASADAGLAWWRKFFEFVGESAFLTGKANGRDGHPPFVADLEWLIKPSNFAKVIEGKYHRA